MEENCTKSLRAAFDELCLRDHTCAAALRLVGATAFAAVTIGLALPVSIPLGVASTVISWRNFTDKRDAVKTARHAKLIDKATYQLPARESTARQPTPIHASATP